MLPQYRVHHDEEEIPLDDNASDVTKVYSSAPYGKEAHLRDRSPSDLSQWSYRSPNPARTRRRQFTGPWLTWLRWGTVVVLASIILILLWSQNVRKVAAGESDAVLKGKVC